MGYYLTPIIPMVYEKSCLSVLNSLDDTSGILIVRMLLSLPVGEARTREKGKIY
jgi:hypothetical protein